MSLRAVTVGRVAFAALIIGAIPAVTPQAQPSADSGVVVVRPARVPVPGSPQAAERTANLRPPPPGPIESRLLPIPDAPSAAPPPPVSAAAPIFVNPPVSSLASPSGPAVAASRSAEPAPSTPGTPLAVIPFAGQSANLTDAMRGELDQIAKRLAEQGVRRIEVRGYAFGGSIDSRKVALARALVVRAYLIDAKIKARIEVGSFEGEGSHVEILAPRS